jgi:hypothetical protein
MKYAGKSARKSLKKRAAADKPCRNADLIEVDAAAVPGLLQDELERLTVAFLRLGYARIVECSCQVREEFKRQGMARGFFKWDSSKVAWQ